MRKPFLSMGSAVLALAMFATSFTAVDAAPVRPNVSVTEQSDVVQVRHRRWHHHRAGNISDYRGRDYRHARRWRDGRPVYYNGHRGYRYYRHGYRRHNGFWFPGAAFATGVIVGGAISRPSYGMSRNHVEYCMAKYRSYRVSDDTYQPNYGPRRRCR